MCEKKYKLFQHINVLGAEYLIYTSDENHDERLKDCDGVCDYYAKEILIRKEPDTWHVREYMEKVIRHEIIHAYMFESGLSLNWEHKQFGQEETVVDWFALQMDKIVGTVQEAVAGLNEDKPEEMPECVTTTAMVKDISQM